MTTRSHRPGRKCCGIAGERQDRQGRGVPLCQDTGLAVVFIEVGQDVHLTGGGLVEAVTEGVRNAYVKGF